MNAISHIVVVGAGFTGLHAARCLMEQSRNVRVTVIDDEAHFLFTPRLIDALEDPSISISRFTAPLGEIAARAGFVFRHGRVTNIDRTNKSVSFLSLPNECPDAITYDTLILAQGADTQYYDIEGSREYTLPLKRAEHVTAIHERATSIVSKGIPASFIVVGAGASGVEALFALKDFVRTACRKINPQLEGKMRYTLIQAGPEILPGFLPVIIKKTKQEMEKHGLRVLTNEAVQNVTRTTVSTTQYKDIPADLIIWTAGIKPNELPITPPLPTEGPGWITVDHHLVAGPDIFAGGDISSYKERNVTIPKNAQTGMTMGAHLAKNVLRHIARKRLQPFHYVSKGNILVLGPTGFIDIKGICIKTRFTHHLREMLYRMRQHQMVG